MYGHFTDFVQKHGTALGLFKQTFVVFVGTGERAFFVAEQHVFNQVLRQCGAVQCDKRAFGAVRGFVQHARQHFLAGAGRANQQGGDFGLRHTLGQCQQMLTDRIDKHKTLGLGAVIELHALGGCLPGWH